MGYDPITNSVCFCFCLPFPFFFPPAPTSAAGTATSSISPVPTVSSCGVRPGAHAEVAGGVLLSICCNWPVRAEMTGGALGAPELGSVGNAAFVSAGAGGGGAGGGFPPCNVVETVLVLLLPLLLPLPPVPTLATDADHAVLRAPRWRTPGVGPVVGGCGEWRDGCCGCGCGGTRRGG